MKTGWLVINHFLNTKKFSEIYLWLNNSSKKYGLNLELKTNCELMSIVNSLEFLNSNKLPDFVLFWDKDIHLAKILESMGLRLFNRAESIRICDDKALTHIILREININMPRTVICPMTYYNIGYNDLSFVDNVADAFGYPFVIKESHGSFGMQVYLAACREEAIYIINKTQGRSLIFQEFISSSFGKDIRLNIVGGKMVAAMLRYNDTGDFRANITNGGKMQEFNPTKEYIEAAINVCSHLKLDFAGVDLLFGKNNEPVLCEVNSNAHFKNIYDLTGINVADYIIEHILNCLS